MEQESVNSKSRNILVIGGTRLFGRRLVQNLLDNGDHVTIATRGLTPDNFGQAVQRVQVDRRHESAMRQAFENDIRYDVVYDQMCYNPLDARIAVDVFAHKTERYIMASTIEVYRELLGSFARPFSEGDFDPNVEQIDLTLPWHQPQFAETHYGIGKRQAEAYFTKYALFPFVAVRIAHVLAGPEDFTGRLAAYIERASQHSSAVQEQSMRSSSFLNIEEISRFLLWIGQQSITGAINAACAGSLSSHDIYQAIFNLTGSLPSVSNRDSIQRVRLGQNPFDYPFPYEMETSLARKNGYEFSHIRDWLGNVIGEHLQQKGLTKLT